MKKIILFLVFLFLLLFTSPITVNAEGEFTTDYDVIYEVKETGATEVINKITLTNVFSNLYATSYSVVLDSMSPKNIKAFDLNGPLEINEVVNGSKTSL